MPALVRSELCRACEECTDACPVSAIDMIEDHATVDAEACTECNACIEVCPELAIVMSTGEWDEAVWEDYVVTREPLTT